MNSTFNSILQSAIFPLCAGTCLQSLETTTEIENLLYRPWCFVSDSLLENVYIYVKRLTIVSWKQVMAKHVGDVRSN